jgi:hypothetical protein
VTRERPVEGCVEVVFRADYAVASTAEVALEDYARALTRAAGAEALPAGDGPGRLRGVHLCAPAVRPEGAVRDDIEAFARDLAGRTGDGLGWS